MRRFKGELTVTLSDGSVEHCHIQERGRKNFGDRVQEDVKMILDNAPPGHVKINYKGDFAAGLYDSLKELERKRNETKE